MVLASSDDMTGDVVPWECCDNAPISPASMPYDMTGDVVPWECCENAPISPASMPYAWITMVGCASASVPTHLTILPPQVEAALL